LRRLRYLMRFSSIEANVNILYEELKFDKEIQDIFKVCILYIIYIYYMSLEKCAFALKCSRFTLTIVDNTIIHYGTL